MEEIKPLPDPDPNAVAALERVLKLVERNVVNAMGVPNPNYQISRMLACRELDALIGKEVLELDIKTLPPDPYILEDGATGCVPEHFFISGGGRGLPAYSKKVQDCFDEIVPKLEEKSWFIRIEKQSRTLWRVYFIKQGMQENIAYAGSRVITELLVGDSLPLLICQSALIAVRMSKREE